MTFIDGLQRARANFIVESRLAKWGGKIAAIRYEEPWVTPSDCPTGDHWDIQVKLAVPIPEYKSLEHAAFFKAHMAAQSDVRGVFGAEVYFRFVFP